MNSQKCEIFAWGIEKGAACVLEGGNGVWRRPVLCAFVFAAVVAGVARADSMDVSWDSHFSLPPGVNGEVFALVGRGTDLFVGGDFTLAGGCPASGIARWDGSNWFSLGDGVSGSVYSLAFLETNLYVGGLFNSAGGIPATNIAMWDGHAWHSLNGGTGPSANSLDGVEYVSALLSNGNCIYAGGHFEMMGGVQATNIAKWDGTNWSALGSGVGLESAFEGWQAGSVQCLVAVDGLLLAGGRFARAGNVAATNVACWDGTNWSGIGGITGGGLGIILDGEVFYGVVNCLENYRGRVVAGGNFTQAGGVSVTNLAEWNGVAWAAVGGGVGTANEGGPCHLLPSENGLWVAGNFSTAGGTNLANLAFWNDVEWSGLGGGMGQAVNTVSQFGGDLFAGGSFGAANGTPAAFVARWSGLGWSALGTNLPGNALVGAIQSVAIDDQRRVYVAGHVAAAGTNNNVPMAKWDGTNWSSFQANWIKGGVETLYASEEQLFAAGRFVIPEAGATNFSCWTGTNWVGFGVDAKAVIRFVSASPAHLYVGGFFDGLGTATVTNLAFWDGLQWSSLGTSPWNRRHWQSIDAMTGAGGSLYVAGWFLSPGPGTYDLARWDGTNWSSLGHLAGPGGRPPSPSSLAVFRGDLFAVGLFSLGGTNTSLLRWDGHTWSDMGSPFTSATALLEVVAGDDYLYVCGVFTNAGTTPALNIARWNGTHWFSLGSGLQAPSGRLWADVLAVRGNKVCVAGKFDTAGGKPSYGFALWDEPPLPSILHARRLENGTFGFRIFGSRGQKVQTRSSDDLMNWSELNTHLIQDDPIDEVDNSATTAVQRFYHVRLVP